MNTQASASSPGASAARNSKGGKKRFPAEYRKLPPALKLKWLGGLAAKREVEQGRLQFNQLSAEAKRLEKERVQVLQIVPGPARLDEQQGTGRPFPPQASDPACQMREADRVLNRVEEPVLWPAAYLSDHDGVSCTYDVDCFDDVRRRSRIDGEPVRHGGTDSASAGAFRGILESRQRVKECRLEPVSTAALQATIDRYNATHPVRV